MGLFDKFVVPSSTTLSPSIQPRIGDVFSSDAMLTPGMGGPGTSMMPGGQVPGMPQVGTSEIIRNVFGESTGNKINSVMQPSFMTSLQNTMNSWQDKATPSFVNKLDTMNQGNNMTDKVDNFVQDNDPVIGMRQDYKADRAASAAEEDYWRQYNNPSESIYAQWPGR